MGKKTIVLDFDGVLHSYTSGWKGARNIPDDPVPDAMRMLVEYLQHFEVAIVSSRSHQLGWRRAMKRWLRDKLSLYYMFSSAVLPFDEPNMEWPEVAAENWSRKIVSMIGFPRHKPPAFVSIDDRAIQFSGKFPLVSDIEQFKPWNKQGV